MLPGMDGTGNLFSPLLAQLPAHIVPTVIRYSATSKLSYSALVEMVQKQISTHQPYVLLAESFSGPIAISLAAKANAQLKGVILSCTFASNPRRNLSKLSFLVPKSPINTWTVPMMYPLLLGKHDNPELRQQLLEALTQASPEVIRYRLDEVMAVDETLSLKAITQPILYLQANNDYIVPASAGKNIVKLAQQAQIVSLDATHLLLQVAAKEAALQISNFIDKLYRYRQ
jgi:pimeloyl-ACP methyl ester carboxylesterase